MKHLFRALAAFQQEVPVLHKGTKGYSYSYTDLPTIFRVINPLMQKHGLGKSLSLVALPILPPLPLKAGGAESVMCCVA